MKKDKKGIKHPPFVYSIPFLSVLHQNKALYNFRKSCQDSIAERNIGLEYVLPTINYRKLRH